MKTTGRGGGGSYSSSSSSSSARRTASLALSASARAPPAAPNAKKVGVAAATGRPGKNARPGKKGFSGAAADMGGWYATSGVNSSIFTIEGGSEDAFYPCMHASTMPMKIWRGRMIVPRW
jgi:hypothetical protein